MKNATRVTEGWTGPGRRDSIIEPLKPKDDGLHMDRRGMYEWWYFDAHLDNGYTIVVFFHASNPNPGLEGKTGLEIVLLRPDGVRVQKFIPYKKSEFTAARDKAEVTIGQNTLRVHQRDNNLPFWKELKREKQSTLFWVLFRNANNTQAAFRPSQGMATMLGAFDTWDLAHTQAEYVAKIKQPYIKQGLILDDGGDLGSGGTFESGHLGYLEGIILYDPGNPKSAMAARELVETGGRDAIDLAMGVPIAAFGVEANRTFGPACSDYHVWLTRIKSALDPNTASDPFFYAEALKDERGD